MRPYEVEEALWSEPLTGSVSALARLTADSQRECGRPLICVAAAGGRGTLMTDMPGSGCLIRSSTLADSIGYEDPG
jgi:hypothetical protein